jgi:DNA polymerase III alpha subunit (gram-positive type)
MSNGNPTARTIYIVTDIECDGGNPGANSMIAFASVAVSDDGARLGEFEAVLEPLEGASRDPNTMKWWSERPAAWSAATRNPAPAKDAMKRFVDWVRSMPGPCIFAAHPLAFDGHWIDFYLRRFTRYAVLQGHYDPDKLFASAGLCLRSYAAAIMGRPVAECDVNTYPKEWLGNEEHTHRAIDDARGYGNLLVTLMRLSRARRAAEEPDGRTR